MTNASKSPRGVRGFKLNNGTFGTWRVQGKIGGYTGWAPLPYRLSAHSRFFT